MKPKIKSEQERKRRGRIIAIRKKVSGTGERPRLAVFRSSKHIYAQLIDDDSGKTLAAASTQTPVVRDEVKGLKKVAASEKVGASLAKSALEKGITKVVFDRAGYPYHGRVAALAKGARDGGLSF
ncbi:MAG: 50S ribosomal protein L18 [Deltaproteobacteria bacterium]|nr:50S ribosomal protein L18 [Deltaproteobacteria bacterium]